MGFDRAVLYSFGLYILYVLLPLAPAVLIFRLFPDSKVTVEGPLQNLTINATGAFAAYVVTVLLGFFLVTKVAKEIDLSRQYAVEGTIVDLAPNQYVHSDRFYTQLVTESSGGQFGSRDYNFVVLLNHPLDKPETLILDYWELSQVSGTGPPPTAVTIPLQLIPNHTERFRLQQGRAVPETN
jgi:hypothetical protein